MIDLEAELRPPDDARPAYPIAKRGYAPVFAFWFPQDELWCLGESLYTPAEMASFGYSIVPPRQDVKPALRRALAAADAPAQPLPPMQDDDFSVRSYGLPTRAMSVLGEASIRTAGDVRRLTWAEILGLPNCGTQTAIVICRTFGVEHAPIAKLERHVGPLSETARYIAARQRETEAWELRQSGKTFAAIAKTLHVSVARAQHLCRRKEDHDRYVSWVPRDAS